MVLRHLGQKEAKQFVASAAAVKHQVACLKVYTGEELLKASAAAVKHQVACLKVYTGEELLKVLMSLDELLNEQREKFYSSLRLLVIDSLPGCLAPSLGKSVEGWAIMNKITSMLKKFSALHHVCILITNHLVHMMEKEAEEESSMEIPVTLGHPPIKTRWQVKAALGRFWLHVPSTRLMLNRPQNNESVTLTVLKSNRVKVRETGLCLSDQGIT
ncbi:unnamed protein product [Darwinula stevensoni]|uniref:Uncharacterized protein n=1 Tax=Darwinula stevensoni TaxID=69355 RepID=A0A7R9ADQ5_9CRUS|nr:unnamed protein product [Darwinula stevensoni]CAG0901316.1 unnamed protein product [Darwinula stevensoni]